MAATRAAAKPRAVQDLFVAKVTLYGPRLMAEFGLKDFHAAGVFGNAGHESGGFRLLQEQRPTVKGSRGGWGWFQQTGPRRRAMEAWCRKEKFDPASDEANYLYLCVELRGPEAAALKALRHETTLEGATRSFMVHFERPGIPHLPGRITWAKKALPAIQRGLQAHAVEVAVVAAQPPKPAPAPTKPEGKAKPAAGKHAVASKPRAVRKHAAPVHHVTHRPKRRV